MPDSEPQQTDAKLGLFETIGYVFSGGFAFAVAAFVARVCGTSFPMLDPGPEKSLLGALLGLCAAFAVGLCLSQFARYFYRGWGARAPAWHLERGDPIIAAELRAALHRVVQPLPVETQLQAAIDGAAKPPVMWPAAVRRAERDEVCGTQIEMLALNGRYGPYLYRLASIARFSSAVCLVSGVAAAGLLVVGIGVRLPTATLACGPGGRWPYGALPLGALAATSWRIARRYADYYWRSLGVALMTIPVSPGGAQRVVGDGTSPPPASDGVRSVMHATVPDSAIHIADPTHPPR